MVGRAGSKGNTHLFLRELFVEVKMRSGKEENRLRRSREESRGRGVIKLLICGSSATELQTWQERARVT